MNKPKEWNITVGKKAKILAKLKAPMHQLGRRDLDAFLKAIVVRYRTENAREMLAYYVNRRKGSIQRAFDAPKIVPYFNFEHRWNGVWCGTWDRYARAVYELTAEEAQSIKDVQDANKRGA